MTTPVRLTNGRSVSHGLGWFMDRFNGHRFGAHWGTTVTGHSAVIRRYTDDRVTVIVLGNVDDGGQAVDAMSKRIADIYVPGVAIQGLKARPTRGRPRPLASGRRSRTSVPERDGSRPRPGQAPAGARSGTDRAALRARTSLESLGEENVDDSHFNLDPSLATNRWYPNGNACRRRFLTFGCRQRVHSWALSSRNDRLRGNDGVGYPCKRFPASRRNQTIGNEFSGGCMKVAVTLVAAMAIAARHAHSTFTNRRHRLQRAAAHSRTGATGAGSTRPRPGQRGPQTPPIDVPWNDAIPAGHCRPRRQGAQGLAPAWRVGRHQDGRRDGAEVVGRLSGEGDEDRRRHREFTTSVAWPTSLARLAINWHRTASSPSFRLSLGQGA